MIQKRATLRIIWDSDSWIAVPACTRPRRFKRIARTTWRGRTEEYNLDDILNDVALRCDCPERNWRRDDADLVVVGYIIKPVINHLWYQVRQAP